MANGNIDPSQLSAFGQYLLSGESDLKDEDLLSTVADEVALGRIMSQADAAREESVAAQETTQEQPTTPSFSMNPFGASSQSMPSIFGSDLQNQEAIDQLSNIADIGLKVIGARDPRSPELLTQLEEEGVETVGGPGPLEAFLPSGLITKVPKVLGGLQKLSRFKPSTPTSQLPVPRTSQLPDVPGGRPPAVRTSQSPEVVTRPPSTVVRPTGPKRVEGTVVNPLANVPPSKDSIIPQILSGTATGALGGTLIADQLMQDPSQEEVAITPEGVAEATTAPKPQTPIQIHTDYLGFLKDQGVSDDERTKIAAQMIAPFLAEDRMGEYLGRPTRPKGGSAADAPTQVSAKDDSSAETLPELSFVDYKRLARAAGFKGSAVSSAAKQMQIADQTKALKSAADIAATQALINYRQTGKVTIPESAKTLAAVEEYFSTLNIPFRDEGGNLTTEAREAIASRGRLGEDVLGSGLEEVILLDRQGRQRSVPSDQVEDALASGYTRFLEGA